MITLALKVDVLRQQLFLLDGAGRVLAEYPVSTAANGLGEQKNSFKTPRGHHQIRAKIGDGLPINTVFRGRRPTGEVYEHAMGVQKDWILTRILWLSGLEQGFNRLGAVDTMQRYVYIHGTADEVQIGKQVSHGCIRMRNQDILELYDRVQVGERVYII